MPNAYAVRPHVLWYVSVAGSPVLATFPTYCTSEALDIFGTYRSFYGLNLLDDDGQQDY